MIPGIRRIPGIARTDPRLSGAFVEHLGRCVYGGIFEPEPPTAQGGRCPARGILEHDPAAAGFPKLRAVTVAACRKRVILPFDRPTVADATA
jgi:hypothetical protein